MSADEYVREATRWARGLTFLDHDIQLVSCGKTGWNEWDRIVIEGLADLVDYHSIHLYTGSEDYWTNVLQPHQAERAIRSAIAQIRHTAYRRKIANPPKVAYDEWNVWYRKMTVDLAERYTFTDALAVGTYLNVFIRNAGWVTMANLAQMVNAIAPIVATPQGAAVQPIYYPVLMHAQAALDEAVDVHVYGSHLDPVWPDSPGRWPYKVADLGPFTAVDAAASVSASQDRVALTLVNRDPDHGDTAEIVLRDHAFAGTVEIKTITAGGPGDPVVMSDVETVHMEHGTETPKDGTVVLHLPPQSFTLIEAAISR
jgi:alpha-N-arabinofuranosidase